MNSATDKVANFSDQLANEPGYIATGTCPNCRNYVVLFVNDRGPQIDEPVAKVMGFCPVCQCGVQVKPPSLLQRWTDKLLRRKPRKIDPRMLVQMANRVEGVVMNHGEGTDPNFKFKWDPNFKVEESLFVKRLRTFFTMQQISTIMQIRETVCPHCDNAEAGCHCWNDE